MTIFYFCCRFLSQKLSMAKSSSRQSYLDNSNVFGYICGKYTLQSSRSRISEFAKRASMANFKVLHGDQDKEWVPHIVCQQCVEHLRQWTKTSLHFGIPMAWCEPKNHFYDCQFCVVGTAVINRKNMNSLLYPNLESAIRVIKNSIDKWQH